MNVVIDASAVIELLICSTRGRVVAGELGGLDVLHAPELMQLEVLNQLRKAERRGLVPAARVVGLYKDLRALRIRLHPHAPSLNRIWELRYDVNPYDAAYLALSELLHAPLLTCDAELANAPGHHARTIVAR